jgi:hypothetical protein
MVDEHIQRLSVFRGHVGERHNAQKLGKVR